MRDAASTPTNNRRLIPNADFEEGSRPLPAKNCGNDRYRDSFLLVFLLKTWVPVGSDVIDPTTTDAGQVTDGRCILDETVIPPKRRYDIRA